MDKLTCAIYSHVPLKEVTRWGDLSFSLKETFTFRLEKAFTFRFFFQIFMFEDLNLLNKDIHYMQYYAGKVSMLFKYFFGFALAFARYNYLAYLFFGQLLY